MWHTLALALGSRTVAEWKRVMSRNEFSAWCEYYLSHPFDDFHRFHRPAALVASSMAGTVEDKLAWLAPALAALPSEELAGPEAERQYSQADLNTFKALGMTRLPPRAERK